MRYEQNTLRHLQLAELGILRAIDRVCREYDIIYEASVVCVTRG